jgi:hypothetical protein
MKWGFLVGATVAAFAVARALAVPAQASTITTYVAQDNGVLPTGTFTNSDAEQTIFLAAAAGFGTVHTHGVGSQTIGATSGIWLNGDGSWSYTGPSVASLSGVTNTQTGLSIDGFQAYNRGGSNTNWLGMELAGNSITFNNTYLTHSFGAYFTGLSGLVQISFNDGSGHHVLTIDSLGVNGGVEYWGFTDSSAFSSLTIIDFGGDNFGIDGISFNKGQLAPTPLPAALPLFASGLGLLGLLGWRSKKKKLTMCVA